MLYDRNQSMFTYAADRGVSEYLDVVSFVKFRSTCKVHYSDEEAWRLRVYNRCGEESLKNARETLALRYLLSWATHFPDPMWSAEWLQHVVEWLEYKVSIKIIHSFILQHKSHLLYSLNMCVCSPKQRIKWWWCLRNHSIGLSNKTRLFKRPRDDVDDFASSKRQRKWFDTDRYFGRSLPIECL